MLAQHYPRTVAIIYCIADEVIEIACCEMPMQDKDLSNVEINVSWV